MSRLDDDAFFYDQLLRLEIDYLWEQLREHNWTTLRCFAFATGATPGAENANEIFKRDVVDVLVQDADEAEFTEPALYRLWCNCVNLCASHVDPPGAHEQSYSFALEDWEAWAAHLSDHGYVVLRGVANAKEVEDATALFWREIEELHGVSREDSSTWTNWAVDKRGLMAGLTHSAGAWAIRGLPKVKQAFGRIWNEDELLVSMDVVLLWRPWWINRAWLPTTEGFHLDQNPFSKPHRVCVQGMVPLVAVTEETGGLYVVPDSHSDPMKTEYKRRYPNWDLYIVSGAPSEFESCNGSYRVDGFHNGKSIYANSNMSIIYFDQQWKLSLNQDTNAWCFSVNSQENEPPGGIWEPHNASHVCHVQKGRLGADWCPCNGPNDPSADRAKLLQAEPGDLILWDSRTVHGGCVGNGALRPPPGASVDLARLSVTVNMTPKAWASEEALQSRREALRGGWNMTMYPHEVGTADGTVQEVLLDVRRSERVRWIKPAQLSAEQAMLV